MYLNVTVHTPVGAFTGTLSKSSSPREDLEKLRDHLQQHADAVSYLVIFDGDEEISIPNQVYKASVAVFTIEDRPA